MKRMEEEGEGRRWRFERKRRQTREKAETKTRNDEEESPPSLDWSHNVTCERCLLSHNGER